jgi:hypothetical protein
LCILVIRKREEGRRKKEEGRGERYKNQYSDT